MTDRPANRTGEALKRRTEKLRAENALILTEQRKQWLLDNYATCGLHVLDIIKTLNAFPGRPLTTDRQIHTLAAKLGVKRSHLVQIPGSQGKGFHIVNYDVWSKERRDYLQDHWLDEITIHQLLERLNQIPASKPIGGYKAVKYQAKRMGLANRGDAAIKARYAKFRNKPKKDPRIPVWTPERCIYLRELWPQKLTANAIKNMIEEKYPGSPISSSEAVKRKAYSMQLPPRSIEVQRAAISMSLREMYREKRGGGLSLRERAQMRAQGHTFESVSAHKPKTATFSRGAHTAPIMYVAPPEPKEQRPEFADNAVNKKMEKARAMLQAKKDPYDVHLASKLPLREVYRLQAELKGRL